MIKKIYCLGTSHTEGGGFHNADKNKKCYGHILDDTSMMGMSYPGILQKLLGKDVKVHNIAKSGSGNERTRRILWNIITERSFNKDEVLFLLEPADIGRAEFYSNTINDFIIANYSAPEKNQKHFLQLTKRYYSDGTSNSVPNTETQKILDRDVFPTICSFINETNNEEHLRLKTEMNLNLFYSFLKQAEIKHKIVHGLEQYIKPKDYDNWFKGINSVVYNIFGKDTTVFTDFAYKNNLLIKNETKMGIDDFHQGYFINNIVARTIYNELVTENLVKGSKVKIKSSRKDWNEFYKQVNKTNPII